LTVRRHEEKRSAEEAGHHSAHYKMWAMLISAFDVPGFVKARITVLFVTLSTQCKSIEMNSLSLVCELGSVLFICLVVLYRRKNDNSMNAMKPRTELFLQDGEDGKSSVRHGEPSMPSPQTNGKLTSLLGWNASAQAISPVPVPICEEVSNDTWAVALQSDGSRHHTSGTMFLHGEQNRLNSLWMRWFGGGVSTPSRPARQSAVASSLTAGGMFSMHGCPSRLETHMSQSSTSPAQQDEALAATLLLGTSLHRLPASSSQSALVPPVPRVLCPGWAVPESLKQSLMVPRLEPTSTGGHAMVCDAAGDPTLKVCFKLSALSDGRKKLPATLAAPQHDECLVLYSVKEQETRLASCRSSFNSVFNDALTIHDAAGELFGLIRMRTGKLAGGFEAVADAGSHVYCSEKESGSLCMTDGQGRALAATKDSAMLPPCQLLQVKPGVDAGLLVLCILASDLLKADALPGKHAHENVQ